MKIQLSKLCEVIKVYDFGIVTLSSPFKTATMSRNQVRSMESALGIYVTSFITVQYKVMVFLFVSR